MRLFFRAKDRSSPSSVEGRDRKHRNSCHLPGDPQDPDGYHNIVAALAHRQYRRAFEPGCSVGALSEHLATLCDAVEASDLSPLAVMQAQARCAHLSGVQVTCRALAKTDTAERFDLVVLDEIGYHFSAEDWQTTVDSLVGTLRPGSTLLGRHRLGHSVDLQLTGDIVHEILGTHTGLRLEHTSTNEEFRLDRWIRV